MATQSNRTQSVIFKVPEAISTVHSMLMSPPRFTHEYQELDERWTPLLGFSGCKVFLVESGKNIYVKKISKDKDYNNRLIQQKDKQEKFIGLQTCLTTAMVLRDGHTPSGLYYFDMDHLRGESAASALESLPLSNIRTWGDALTSICQMGTGSYLPAQVFCDKLKTLKNNLISFSAHQLIDEAFARLGKADWAGIPQSACHGDLTLENVIIHDGHFHLIDFLDSFADSWFIDAAKLMQDFYGRWSFRNRPMSHNAELRLLALRERVEAGWTERHKDCLSVINNLYILNLLRILPYCSTQAEIERVENMLNDSLKRS